MKNAFPLLTSLAAATLPMHAQDGLPGRAAVTWMSQTQGYTAGEPVVTAFKMELEAGWHTYWINPGEAGLPLTARFDLPDGWTVDPPQFPIPVRFTTGDLHDFGYEGTVLFPIVLHPPAGATGDVEITGSFDWLACDDDACIPGDATLTLALAGGVTAQAEDAGEIAETLKKIPAPAPEGWSLDVTVNPETLTLTLQAPESVDPQELEFFPLTLNVVHPASPFAWAGSSGTWTADVTKSPFIPDPLDALEIVVHPAGMPTPIIVKWQAKR